MSKTARGSSVQRGTRELDLSILAEAERGKVRALLLKSTNRCLKVHLKVTMAVPH